MNLTDDYFTLFDLPQAYRIDSASLDQRYRDIQAKVHPDRFADASDAEKRLSMQWTTLVNEAYQTLRNPTDRARYLLSLRGVETQEESNTAMPAAFLMQQMEWREAISEARTASDMASLEHLFAKIRTARRDMEGKLAQTLDDTGDLDTAAGTVRMMKFMERLEEDVKRALESLET